MADIAIFRINYKSDFILTLNSDAGWMIPFCIKFWTGAPSQAYYAYYDGMSYTHCAPVEGEPTKLLVQFDDHHLPIGDLQFQIGYHFTVADFPTSIEDEVINQASVIIEVDDAPAQVMLDLNGETAPEIEFSLPAYANEAQRIANEEARIAAEQQRIANEESRIAAETIRQQNEQQRIDQETARVNEFATLKSQSQAATSDANDAATMANQKAQLAADKAALADDAATLAIQKAQLAADKAALANDAAQLAADKAALAQQNAEYAQQQGSYAKDQGDYAKTQGNYAKEQGDTALADHTRAESDHGIAVDDHTQAGNDHTRAESDHGIAVDDHTQAGNDHTRAESDHGIAADDHTQAGNDHTRAESDHGIAADDHTQAGNDHTRAESDHTRAESDHAAVEVFIDSLGVFDLSKYNAVGGVLATYADLSAALNALNALDSKYKYGGMSFKFVQSSDNKYVQYRLMSDSWSITESDWQGVDDKPTAGSKNFVESGGVYKTIKPQFDLLNNIGIVRLESGSIDSTTYQNIANDKRARTVGYLRGPLSIAVNDGYKIVQKFIYRIGVNGYEFVDRTSPSATIQNLDSGYAYRLTFSKTDNTQVIDDNELGGIIGTYECCTEKESKFATGEYLNNTGIDNTPTRQSENLIKSKAVAKINNEVNLSDANTLSRLLLEIGVLDNSTGAPEKNTKRARTAHLVSSPFSVKTKSGFVVKNIYRYLFDGTDYVFDRYNSVNDSNKSVADDSAFYAITFSKTDETQVIDASELNDIVDLFFGKFDVELQNIRDNISNINTSVDTMKGNNWVLSNLNKLSQGYYVSVSNGTVSISSSDSWENWLIPVDLYSRGSVKLGANNGASHINVAFLSSSEIVAGNVVSYLVPNDRTGGTTNKPEYEFDTPSSPSIKYVLLCNRIASNDNPNGTFTRKLVEKLDKNVFDQKTLSYDAQIAVLQQAINSILPASPIYICKHRIEKFNTYADLMNAYDTLINAHPGIATKTDLGFASDAVSKLYEIEIDSGNYNIAGLRSRDAVITKPIILIFSGDHGYEPASVTSLYLFVKDLLDGNGFLSNLRNNFIFKIIPCVNPWGYDNNRRGNYNNVDLNRNFDADWIEQGDPTAYTSYYSGPSAASEAETQIVQSFIDNNTDACLVIDTHNSSYHNEVSTFAANNSVGKTVELKRSYLINSQKLSSYLTSELECPETTIWGYTGGGATTGGEGTSRAYIYKKELVGGTFETSQNINETGSNSPTAIAVGTDSLVALLNAAFDTYNISKEV